MQIHFVLMMFLHPFVLCCYLKSQTTMRNRNGCTKKLNQYGEISKCKSDTFSVYLLLFFLAFLVCSSHLLSHKSITSSSAVVYVGESLRDVCSPSLSLAIHSAEAIEKTFFLCIWLRLLPLELYTVEMIWR